MGKSFKRYCPNYKNREREPGAHWSHGPAHRPEPQRRANPDLVAIAASSSVQPRRVEPGKRTLSDKQMFLALHASDSYQFDMRHFVGELQARVGVRSPRPVVPRPVVEMTDEEAEEERKVRLRRYWARNRRRD